MDPKPFAGFNPRPSPWGYNWTTENISSTVYQNSPPSRENGVRDSPASTTSTSSPEPQMMAQQYANMPAALLASLKRDKKPFTYTPGGVNLSEVLNARLQKRMERKKKYSEERMAAMNDNDSQPTVKPPKQVIVMPTYNSPLDMYSMENALEALECQAELVANDKRSANEVHNHSSLSSPSRSATLPRNHTFKFEDKDYDPGKNVAQSKAFKVLQIITDTDEEPGNKGKSHHQDEMRFTGIRDSKAIPSKFFQTLQKITGTDEDEEEENVKNNNARNMTRVETSKPNVYEKQQTRPGFLPQPSGPQSPPQKPVAQNHAPQFQPMKNHQMVQEPSNSPFLKRPAAFLPMKTGSDPLSRVKPVHPTFLANGPRNIYNQLGGTDF
ncbi:DUF4749 domain-containing protein [Trichonephila clavata]|uniref:DUF4749 domain-containing protein n=1 Tax=Trichonephila clavata TaxID=2740835 RepID=A0A8X6GSU5_TRICU|nr:DUF4749 domain-containing protein [Trichonephila clavata]